MRLFLIIVTIINISACIINFRIYKSMKEISNKIIMDVEIKKALDNGALYIGYISKDNQWVYGNTNTLVNLEEDKNE